MIHENSLKLISDDYDYIRDRFQTYVNRENKGRVARFTAAFEAGVKMQEMMKGAKYASITRLVPVIGIEEIDSEFLKRLMNLLSRRSVDALMDIVYATDANTVPALWAAITHKSRTTDEYKNSPSEVVMRMIAELSQGLARQSTYEFSLEELKKISACLKNYFPSITRESALRDQWFFSMAPCVCCNKQHDVVDRPNGHEIFDINDEQNTFVVPICPECLALGKKPSREYMLRLYVTYSKRLEEEITDSMLHFHRDEFNDIQDDGVITYNDNEYD